MQMVLAHFISQACKAGWRAICGGLINPVRLKLMLDVEGTIKNHPVCNVIWLRLCLRPGISYCLSFNVKPFVQFEVNCLRLIKVVSSDSWMSTPKGIWVFD